MSKSTKHKPKDRNKEIAKANARTAALAAQYASVPRYNVNASWMQDMAAKKRANEKAINAEDSNLAQRRGEIASRYTAAEADSDVRASDDAIAAGKESAARVERMMQSRTSTAGGGSFGRAASRRRVVLGSAAGGLAASNIASANQTRKTGLAATRGAEMQAAEGAAAARKNQIAQDQEAEYNNVLVRRGNSIKAERLPSFLRI
jgi:hypothetical protein